MSFISSLFGFIIAAVLYGLILRMILTFCKIDQSNHLYKEINDYTAPLIEPFKKIIGKTAINQYDLPCLLAIFFIEIVHGIVSSLLDFGTWMSLWTLPLFVIIDPFVYVFNLLFFVMALRLLFNWYSPALLLPIREAVQAITQPFLDYSSKVIPASGGFEVGAVFWLIAFKFVSYMIIGTFIAYLH